MEEIIPVSNPPTPRVATTGAPIASRVGSTGRKGNPNRYAYTVGRVQKMVRELVKTPNQWFLARKDATNRSSLAPTLSKYPQIHVATRKTAPKTYNIYVCYVPNEDGGMDNILADDIASWAVREQLSVERMIDQKNRKENRVKRQALVPVLSSDLPIPIISV